MNPIDLSGLRDIHLPIEPSFWPLATGWHVLFITLSILILISFIVSHWYKNKPLPYALKELEKIQKNPENQLKLLSQLLKRVAMAKYGRKKVAPLTEDSWEDFLLSAAPNTFTPKQSHLLAFSIYTTDREIKDKAIFKNARNWIKIILKHKK